MAKLVVGVGLGEEGSSAASLKGFLGSMKRFIFLGGRGRRREKGDGNGYFDGGDYKGE